MPVCKQLARDQVPDPPRWIFEGAVDEGDRRWRFKQGLLIRYIRYVPEKQQRPGVVPWLELWEENDARR